MVNKKNIRLLLFIILGFIFIIVIDNLYNNNRIYSGIYFKDTHLGGKLIKEAEELLDTSHFTFLGPEGKAVSIPLKKMGINVNYKKIVQTGYWLNRSKLWPGSYIDRLKLIKEKVYLPFQYQIDQKRFSQSIAYLAKSFGPKNAYFKVSNDNQVELIPEEFGYRFNTDILKQLINENLTQLNSSLKIKIPFDGRIPPQITVSSLKEKGIEELMIYFATSFDPAIINRVNNIKLAAAKLNNYYLAPGEVFSFNRAIGNATAEKGYKAAPIIISGELVPGIGGGICQISSTLYNIALLANLDILERHSHQLTVPYIGPGRDATISYPSKDFAFRNNKDHYILITTSVKDDKLILRLFGQPLKEKVEINVNVLDTFPPPKKYTPDSKLKPGEEEVIMQGYPGFLVEVWKTVYRGEKKESEDKISEDKYLPYPEIVKQGVID